MKRMKLRPALFAVLGCLLGTASVAAQSPEPQEKPCVQQRDKTYLCNLHTFRHALNAAGAVTLDTDPYDRASERNLRALVTHLHKTIAPHQDADLVIALHAVNSNGIVIGPGDNELARLDVYRAGHAGEPDELMWSETYAGDAEKPWPLIVNALVEQFEDSVKKR